MFGTKKEFNLLKLKQGYTFDLFKTNWTIKQVSQYDWSMDNTSIEYTIQSSEKTAFVEIEFTKGEYETVYSEEITIKQAYLIDAIHSKEIVIEGTLFRLNETYTGDYKNLTTHSNRESLYCYIFYAEDDQQITIEKWNDGSYESFIGNEIKSKKIKNIKEK